MKKLKITLLFLFILAIGVQAQEKSADQKIIEGIYQEEVTGDLKKAEQIFQDVLKNCGEERVICARALYHLGLVAEKKAGGTEGRKAESIYAQLMEKYPEVGDYADLARNRLSKLKDANTFIDPRDGHKYKWVKIGNQVWMAENLAYMPWVNPPKKQEYGIWVYDYNGEDVAEAKATENYQQYGCLYDWPTAMALGTKYLEEPWAGSSENHQGICPPGWRVPGKNDWVELGKTVGGDSALLYDDETDGEIKGASRMKSSEGWLSGGNGNNQSKLAIRPGGIAANKYDKKGIFQELGIGGYFWSSNQPDESGAKSFLNNRFRKAQYYPAFGFWFYGNGNNDPSDILGWIDFESDEGMSLRCIKSDGAGNSPVDPVFESYLKQKPSNTKIEDITYSDVKISQVHLIPRLENRFSSGHMLLSQGQLIDWSPSDSILQSFDLKDFSLKWQMKTFVVNGKSDGTSGIHVFNDTLAYNDGQRICFVNVKKGNLIRSIDSPKGQLMNFNESDQLIIRTGLKTSDFICFEKTTGQKKWHYSVGDSVFFSPFVYQGNTIAFNTYCQSYLYNTDKGIRKVVALNINTGEEEWIFDHRGSSDYKSPVKVDNQIVFNNYFAQYLFSIDATNGEKIWKYFKKGGMQSNMITTGDTIYFATPNYNDFVASVTALNKSGKELWCKRLPSGSMGTPLAIYAFDHKIFAPCTIREIDNLATILRSEIAVLDQSGTGKNWRIVLPHYIISDILFGEENIFIRTNEGIYIYKYPEFK